MLIRILQNQMHIIELKSAQPSVPRKYAWRRYPRSIFRHYQRWRHMVNVVSKIRIILFIAGLFLFILYTFLPRKSWHILFIKMRMLFCYVFILIYNLLCLQRFSCIKVWVHVKWELKMQNIEKMFNSIEWWKNYK